MSFINIFLTKDLVSTLVRNINSPSPQLILLPSLRIIGNFVRVDDALVNGLVLETKGLIEGLKYCLSANTFNIRKEALYIMSNIAAGTADQTDILVSNNVVQDLLTIFQTCHQFFVGREVYSLKKEASWVVNNIVAHSEYIDRVFNTPQLVEYILELVIDPMVEPSLLAEALEPILQSITFVKDESIRKDLLRKIQNFATTHPRHEHFQFLAEKLLVEEEL